jgi:hypothetical protein
VLSFRLREITSALADVGRTVGLPLPPAPAPLASPSGATKKGGDLDSSRSGSRAPRYELSVKVRHTLPVGHILSLMDISFYSPLLFLR